MVNLTALATAFAARNMCQKCSEPNSPLIEPNPYADLGFDIYGWRCTNLKCRHIERGGIDEISTAELLGL